jgi:uncharacterized protein
MRIIIQITFLICAVYGIGNSAENRASQLVIGVEFDAKIFYPKNKSKNIVILYLGGSEGGLPNSENGSELAQNGFPTLALGYFKTKQTPENLDLIPLEYFDKVFVWLATRPELRGKKIAVVGASKGGELALLLASKNPQICAVVAFSPISVVFQGMPKDYWPPRSSWSYKGVPVPFVPYDSNYYFGHSEEIHKGILVGYYQESMKNQDAVKKAEIEVEKINGPILLFSGNQDTIWPSTEMCKMISRRLKKKQFKHKIEHVKYENAGHTLSEFYLLGGTKEGNRHARIDSTRRMLEFLNSLSVTQDVRNPRSLTDKPAEN